MKSNDKIYFLIAGREEPLTGLNDKRWIEVGWTNKPHEIISASDMFILPNKETYFDLILLEVMSIGKPIILTNTGGNKYFKKFENGLLYYDYSEINQAIKQIKDIIDENKLKDLGNLNKKIMLENFTIEIFTNNYIEILKQVIKNEKK